MNVVCGCPAAKYEGKGKQTVGTNVARSDPSTTVIACDAEAFLVVFLVATVGSCLGATMSDGTPN